ncbi:helicase HerA-like domain-containing protein [Luteimicrobium subarcticum]|uniref:Helicase HerA-like C-terminal domain-containing protein n=1 Tax=Luteimicrobium subarcticum TaxID=620910 RepID=A0A2M8WQW6_9MICO|nr:helicase HerA-like domain-containing protein [Luteimicrobium subarcticum]PJI93339.1 hypothetical protein CLV34_1908 [Luteimicrobium subarcticum]
MADDAPRPDDIAALRAAAAEAAAQAAEARAAAAQAALDAALAGAEDAPPAASDDPYAAEVRAAYAAPGGTLPLGALLVAADGAPAAPDPGTQVGFALSMLNRHGLVAGATGTGKTKTLQGMAEGLSAAGVPVFLADVKGDLSGLAVAGPDDARVAERAASVGQEWAPTAFPVEAYSLGGLGHGVPVRTTVTDFGPLLLAKVLGLNDTQESSLGLVFHWADTQGLALLDLKDLQATVAFLTSDEGRAELKGVGGVSAATAGVILREITALQAQGADVFFGEPAFDTADLLRTTADGRGVVSCLELPDVQDRPALFSTFLMWLLADLYHDLPEVGDADRPRLVFFFDEAHLLFAGASKAFLEQVVQTVRLIRSKGVGVFFVTQSPKDVPADVLAQLGNRVQHALRAFTPDDAKALRAAVRTFPRSPYDLEQLLQSLGTGEAVVTVLTEKGAPTPVAWTRVRAPQSSMSPAPADALDALVAGSPLQARYGTAVDNESAFEVLAARIAAEHAPAAQAEVDRATTTQRTPTSGRSDGAARTASSSVDRLLGSMASTLGREITRSLFGTRRRR